MANIRRLHPGVYIKDLLEAMQMNANEFSMRTGISERMLSPIINGKADITFEIADKLATFFDNSINYWTNLQTQYDVYMKESQKNLEIEEDWKLIKNYKPFLLNGKYIDEKDDKESIVKKCRTIVGVNRLALLNIEDSFICLKEQHMKNESKLFPQNFWIALALNEARKKIDKPYNKQKLEESIDEIRNMTIQDPNIFYPRLETILNDCGISFVLLPYLTKSNIYGVTKWFSKENVMLAISNRGGKADLFWFTLFHEISHILMEHRRVALINMAGDVDKEADKYASNILISENDWNEFIKNTNFTKELIAEFAKKVNIHPCIVLGRLHKEKPNVIPYGMFDNYFNISYKITRN